ncbi:DUF2339 domain-containing protein [Salinarimonas sp.]|uniref:DUF2339 domain-containing protein n=1 Tax=Salinarimonas sp. TaxID=2766526 RepID=UPI0032D94E25
MPHERPSGGAIHVSDDLFFLLIGLVLLAIPSLAVAGVVMGYTARQRVRALETRLALAEREMAALRSAQHAPPRRDATPEEAPRPAPEQDLAARPPQATPAPPPLPPPLPPAAAAARPTPEPETAVARPGFEERFGTRWAVWIGGLALALGGIFLVRASIEAGLLGPAARIGLGALFALALMAGGEILRRRTAPIPAFGGAYAPGALTAAGATTAFAVTYAAFALYGFIGPTLAFALLAAIALGTMVAAALHGPALAALGLLGALVAPLLIETDAPNAWALIAYLAFVAASAYGVARLRRWRWLAVSTAVGAGLWTVPVGWISVIDQAPTLAHVALQIALAAGAFVVLPYGRDRAPRPQVDAVATAVLAGFATLAILIFTDDWVGPVERIAFGGVLAAILVAAGLRFAPAAAGPLMGAAIVGGALAFWPVADEIVDEPTRVLPGGISRPPLPEALELFLAFAALASLAIAGAAIARLLRGAALPRWPASLVAAAASGAPLFVLVVVYWALTDQFRVLEAAPVLPFAAVAGAIAAAYAALAAWLQRTSAEADGETPARLLLAGSAAAALAALSAGFVFTLDRGLLTVALALAALGSAFVADRTRIPTLRLAVGVLGFVVLMRLVDDPTIAEDPGRTILLNWLLVGYGVPAVAFALAARLLDRTRRDNVSRFSESLAFVFGAFLVFFQIRHALHGGDPLAPTVDHLEAGLMATAALAFSTLATRIDLLRRDPVTTWGSLAFAALALAFVAGGLGIAANPLLTDEAIVGGPIFNSLLPAYLLPAALAAGLAYAARGARPPWFVEAAGWLSLALGTAWVGLAIRQAAQGARIGIERAATEGEMWAYSAALIGLGIAALAAGFAREDRRARLVGVAFFAAAVLKVFLIDLANLEGVMRAVSFIGLGLALVAIGLAYQRLVARRPPPAGAAGA